MLFRSLTKRKNLLLSGRQALRRLFKANRRLYVAYTLKETFGQLWEFRTPGGARRFFERWRESLKWQRLRAYEKFAKMIDRHWDGIASYCQGLRRPPMRLTTERGQFLDAALRSCSIMQSRRGRRIWPVRCTAVCS